MTDQQNSNIPWQKQPAFEIPADQQLGGPQPAFDPAASVAPSAPAYGQVPPPGWRPGYRAETQQLGYHRLALADPKNRWWTPLVELAIAAPVYLVLSLLVTVLLFVALFSDLDPAINSGVLGTLQTIQSAALESPVMFAYVFGSVALMFPAMWLARIIMGPRPWGLVHSVAGRMRWGWLLMCLGIAALFFVVLPFGLDFALGSQLVASPTASGTKLILLLVLVALIVPFQAYAEELVFRGYLIQTLGRWLKHPAWAIVLPAPLFMLGHAYDLWAQLSILVMGLAAGFVTWRTGGLEAAIALHIVNNLVAMTLGIYGLADPFVQGGSTWGSLVSSVLTQGVFVLVVLWAAKKRGIERVRTAQVWVKTP
ncbi:MAG: type II CAAX endopeptidase family protein [Rothia sp. (in: high G+C Gram-positive bacteria)]|nr:type II CAAX endopeptidase family protein [Rothia sp. (in: high G+C Gram-positive bacteria)]